MFSPLKLPHITLANRIIRAATFENMSDENGNATFKLAELYSKLAAGGVKTIITGFNYTSVEGRALQPFQVGIDDDKKVIAWKKVIDFVKTKYPDIKIILQISHTGRQTTSSAIHGQVRGPGTVKCTYFRASVKPFSEDEVKQKVEEYIIATKRAEKAGFDGIQVHSAHGYLVHQFLSPHTNQRKDKYGIDRLLFLKQIVSGIKEQTSLPIFLKISAADDRQRGLNLPLVLSYWPEIDKLNVDAVEISYGMMEVAFNIIRGGDPLDAVLVHNPLFNRYPYWMQKLFKLFIYKWYKQSFIPYTDLYNLENAIAIKKISKTAILVTGGIRSRKQIETIMYKHKLDGVTLCRPFICEPDIIKQFIEDEQKVSQCTNCNLCTVMCDSKNSLRCYSKG